MSEVFDKTLEELDEIMKRAFDRDGISTLIVCYAHDPFDGQLGTDRKRVGFRGGTLFALGAATYAQNYLLNDETPAED